MLLPLTFCTWLFALLTVNTSLSDVKSYDYLFSAFAIITAVVTLLAHVVFNKRVSQQSLVTVNLEMTSGANQETSCMFFR